jgi:anti-sigma factor ChrR (cupin superfamily)
MAPAIAKGDGMDLASLAGTLARLFGGRLMKIRADFSKKEIVRPGDAEWVASPQPGVNRLMLDRIGEEVARATSLVYFSPGSSFPPHDHGGGEEILVLDGVLEDEHGSYPAGTYLRDPVGTKHQPFSKDGCLIFVKLRHFRPGDNARVVMDTNAGAWLSHGPTGPSTKLLHEFEGEVTSLMYFPPGVQLERHVHDTGQELFILDGTFSDEDGDYPMGTWIRFPEGSAHAPYSLSGCMLLAKAGHLPPPGAFPEV